MTVLSFVAGCDKVPLVAPTGSVITLFASAPNVPANGEIEVVATVIEHGTTASTPTTPGTPPVSTAGAGTPVQNGTLVSFTSTLGRIEPREARTNNGEVRVRFIAGGQSGTATITAYSGGTSGTLKDLLVGTAAAKRVFVTATPQTLGSSGGTAEIAARVEDDGGTGLAGVPVTFTTTAGTVSPVTVTTDSTGVARTTLTSTAKAEIKATAGAQSGTVTVDVAAKSGLAVAAAPTTTSVGVPVVFTITTNDAVTLTDGRINYGDGQSQSLGTLNKSRTDQHLYSAAGTYSVTVTGTNPSGTTDSAGTTVVVSALGVTITSTAGPSPTAGTPITFLAAFDAGANPSVSRYVWTFDDGTPAQETTGRQVIHTFGSKGIKTVRVDVYGVNGQIIGTATTQVSIG